MKPGHWCALGLLVQALVIDALLEKAGHESISTCIRTSPIGRRAVRWMDAHLTDTVQGDVLTMLGVAYAKRLAARVG